MYEVEPQPYSSAPVTLQGAINCTLQRVVKEIVRFAGLPDVFNVATGIRSNENWRSSKERRGSKANAWKALKPLEIEFG